jgi:hypothetical protein
MGATAEEGICLNLFAMHQRCGLHEYKDPAWNTPTNLKVFENKSHHIMH